MASYFKSLRLSTIRRNFVGNAKKLVKTAATVFSAAEVCWFRINAFDGTVHVMDFIHHVHAWYWYYSWILIWCAFRSTFCLLRLFFKLDRLWIDLCVEFIHFDRGARRGARQETAAERIVRERREQRKEQRRLRKHQKKYLVQAISNVYDGYDSLRYGGLRHFSLGNGWYIRFYAGILSIGYAFAYPDADTTETSSFWMWLWPGRPPGDPIPILTNALCLILVLVSFAITTTWAVARIRARAKKGAVAAKLRALFAELRRFVLHNWRIDKALFIGFVISFARWLLGYSDFRHGRLILFSTASLQVLHSAFKFDPIRAVASGVSLAFTLFMKLVRHLLLSSGSSSKIQKHRRIRRRSPRSRSSRRKAYCTVFNVDKRVPDTSLLDFDDTAVTTIICDNSANIHICNDRNMFSSMTAATASKVVATIGGKVNIPAGIGTVTWSWKDDLGVVHSYKIDNVHYFPASPVNILGVTAFARQLNDEVSTGIDTKWKQSKFYWRGGHSRTIHHPQSQLPELPLICDASNNEFCQYIERCSKQSDDSVHFSNSTCYSSVDDSTFATSLLNRADKIEVSPFEVGERLFFTDEGYTSMAYLREIRQEGEVCKYVVELPGRKFVTTTCEHLRSPSQPDIAEVPVTPADFQRDSKNLTDEQLEELASPKSLSPEQQELMGWHLRLGHLPFFILNRLAQIGLIPRRLRKLKDCAPHCPSCSFGQAHRRPWRSKKSKDGKSSSSIRKETEDKPGATVSIDQMISAQPGLVPQISGHLTAARIWAATIFVDHFSKHVYVHLMRDQTQASTLEAKAAYERNAGTHGVQVRGYRADNGRFAEEEFRKEVNRCMQEITFCGVGAHHQNGVVERMIKDLTLTTRTLLLHAKRHWPEMITTMLWPMALKAAEERLNHLSLDMNGETPLSKWTGTDCQILVKDFHTWGCPVFVLDGRLQSNPKGVPKWEPRARVGIYMGHSPSHAGSVALVLNPTTGHISPQFHVVFDDTFSTVPYMREGTVPPHWAELVRNSTEMATDKDFDLSRLWFEGEEDPSETSPTDLPIVSQEEPANEGDSSANEGGASNPPPANEGDEADAGSLPPAPAPAPSTTDANDPYDTSAPALSESTPFQASEGDSLQMPKMTNLETSGLRRSPRLRSKKTGLVALVMGASVFLAGLTNTVFPPVDGKEGLSTTQRIAHRYHSVNSNVDGTINGVLGSIFATIADNDCYTYSGMLKQPDRHKFIEAMIKETAVHEERGHWIRMLRSDMPAGAKTILSIWSFKRKRMPEGLISKYKARLCAHGGMQSWGVDYWETYAPVVNWMSVRFILTVAKIHDLDTKVIDFVLAFPQAKLDVDVFMEVPAGMRFRGVPEQDTRKYVLRLTRSLYGLKQGSANWYNMLSQGLADRGFKSSDVDPCVFIGKKAIVISYVDDCIVISREHGFIDAFIDSLKHGPENFEFTEEGTLESYLGVKFIDFDRGKQFEMTQPFLIDRIIQAVGFEPRMTDARPTPVVKPLLHRDIDGEPRRTSWNYRSVIGMMNYLQQSTRPDISMAVHQCARFCNNPRLSHERAVKRIVKYLIGTKERGVICKPDRSKGLECYADADFAGGWDRGDSENPENVMSRTGYIIMYAGCPVVWCSKLQTEIALSTMEAEYIALSQAMREVIPLISLMGELQTLVPFYNPTPQVRCKIFEDNRSCIVVAESARLTPRTKHIAIKYHHFRSIVKSGQVKIHPINTREQIADIFTKPLDERQFKYLRSLFLHW